jgi:hypothetical protein
MNFFLEGRYMIELKNKIYFKTLVPKIHWEELWEQFINDEARVKLFEENDEVHAREFKFKNYNSETASTQLIEILNITEAPTTLGSLLKKQPHFIIRWGSSEYIGVGQLNESLTENIVTLELKKDIYQRLKRAFPRISQFSEIPMLLELENNKSHLYDLSAGGFSFLVDRSTSTNFKKDIVINNSQITLAEEKFIIPEAKVMTSSYYRTQQLITCKFENFDKNEQKKLNDLIIHELNFYFKRQSRIKTNRNRLFEFFFIFFVVASLSILAIFHILSHPKLK